MRIGRRIEGTRLLGLALLGFAAHATFGIAGAGTSSAQHAARPRPDSPIGTVAGELPPFRWTWPGELPESGFEVILLDDAFGEIARSAPVHALELPTAAIGFDPGIARGSRFHWCVRIADDAAPFSAPAWFRAR